MELSTSRGDWALITGASSGIGREFCLQLAAAGMNVAMVARRAEALSELAATIADRHGTRALPIALDLVEVGAPERVRLRTAAEGIRIRLLVNSAAFGRWGRFEAIDPTSYRRMIDLNVGAMVELCHQFLPDLAGFASSAVINVSSPAALQPVPYMATYAATKAFVSSFSQALHGEWKGRGVLVQTLVPGPTATDFDRTAGAYASAVTARGSPEQVVLDSLAALASMRPVAWNAKGTYKQRIFAGLFPSRVVIKEVAKMFRPPDASS